MNMNEVLATLATGILGSAVHPNDHVNASQSSNDVFPTVGAHRRDAGPHRHTHPRARQPRVALEAKAELWKDAVKSGRTHLMAPRP